MFEDKTYENILSNMLSQVPNEVDKREGSIIYDTLSPVAYELAQHYGELNNLIDLFYADKAVDDWLDRVCSQYGIDRKTATNTIRKGLFYDRDNNLMDIPIGSRFRINDLILEATEKMSTGIFKLRAEQSGITGNMYQGNMLPIDNIDNLGAGILSDVLIDGANAESDEEYRARFFYLIKRPAFGGNIADYESEALTIDGIGAIKVFPVWNGPGTVKLIIGNTTENQASSELVDIVQNRFMPLTADKLGTGLAPVGHTVIVETSTDLIVNIEADIKVAGDYTLIDIQSAIETEIRNYINNIPFSESPIYMAKTMAAILKVVQVEDIPVLTLNGLQQNLILSKTAESFQTPLVGTITLRQVN